MSLEVPTTSPQYKKCKRCKNIYPEWMFCALGSDLKDSKPALLSNSRQPLEDLHYERIDKSSGHTLVPEEIRSRLKTRLCEWATARQTQDGISDSEVDDGSLKLQAHY